MSCQAYSQLLKQQLMRTQRLGCRCLQTSARLDKNRRAAVPKCTNNRSKPLTFEEAMKPEHIGVHKTWKSMNTSKHTLQRCTNIITQLNTYHSTLVTVTDDLSCTGGKVTKIMCNFLIIQLMMPFNLFLKQVSTF